MVISKNEIATLPYVDLLALLGESNRPPGGMDSVRRIIVNCHLRPGVEILHAGCNAGFLSREIARLSGCKAMGIDINKNMVDAARERSQSEGIAGLVTYEQQDMRAMKFPDHSFDVTLSGGALAFVNGQRSAVEEWVRVTRPYGLVADVELYYRTRVPPKTRDKVSSIIGVEVPEYRLNDWLSVFDHPLLEPYYRFEGAVRTRTADDVLHYCERMAAYRAASWEADAREMLVSRLSEAFSTFNENLSYMGYVILIYRRVDVNSEPALFV